MIKKLKIENFKSIQELEIELAPLTIFVGPNGAGKTSILEAIALMSQAATLQYDLIDAKNRDLVKFEDESSLFHNKNLNNWLSLGFEVELNENESEELKAGISQDLEHLKDDITPKLLDLFTFLKKNPKAVEYVNKIKKVENAVYQEHTYSINGNRIGFRIDLNGPETIPEGLPFSNWSNNFLPNSSMNIRRMGTSRSEYFEKLNTILRRKLSNVYYLSPERGNIPWYYSVKEQTRSDYVGRMGEHTLEILSNLMKTENDDKRLPYELFSEKFGIKDIWSGWDRENVLTSSYRDPWLKSAHKFPSLGHGSKQLLSVIAQLAISNAGSIILIDEPEISLHPASQAKLPMLFGNAVKEGKQILITSHSSYFPLSIQQLFDGVELKGQTTRGDKKINIKLDVKDVKIYQINRDRNGNTKEKLLEIDKDGLKEAIPSFVEVERELLQKYIDNEEVREQS